MRGIQRIEVSNRDAKFKFELNRNITIVRGESATGKTTLFEMIADYTRLKEKSGVNISSRKQCVALVDLDWNNQLSNTKDSIVFIDEGADYIRTQEFAEAIKKSDNYYVIFNRESLHQLPYSVNEIYEIKASGKYHEFKRIYRELNHVYYMNNIPEGDIYVFSILLTEDSKAGLQFYENYFNNRDVKCFTSGANSNIFQWLKKHKDEYVFVVADGAAFGSEIDRVIKLKNSVNFSLCLPESFEWLILKSGLINDTNLDNIINNPSEYVESGEYFSWENYFEKYLVRISEGTHYSYSKSSLNDYYRIPENAQKIIQEIYKQSMM